MPNGWVLVLLDGGGWVLLATPAEPAVPAEFSALPPALQAQAWAAYASNDEAILIATAQRLEAVGYPRAAEGLRLRAVELRVSRVLDPSRLYRIRGAEVPSALALWYAGDGNRWRELLPWNPALHVRKVHDIEFVVPWKPGMTVLVPPTWDIHRIQGRPLAQPRG